MNGANINPKFTPLPFKDHSRHLTKHKWRSKGVLWALPDPSEVTPSGGHWYLTLYRTGNFANHKTVITFLSLFFLTRLYFKLRICFSYVCVCSMSHFFPLSLEEFYLNITNYFPLLLRFCLHTRFDFPCPVSVFLCLPLFRYLDFRNARNQNVYPSL